jgi:hypothetical protein
MALARSLGSVLFAFLATASCTIQVTPKDKGDAGAAGEAGDSGTGVVCCHTEPEAGPEGCLCEPVAKDIIMVTGTSCSASTTVNGQAVDFTGYVVSTCP